MKKFILSTFALLLTLATIVPANARLGHRGENPVNTTIGTSGTSTGRYGHKGENPNAPRGHRGENPNSNSYWENQHQGTRAGVAQSNAILY